MKKASLFIICIIALSNSIISQDLGKISIRNGFATYPKFIASLNGVRLTNDYASVSTFNLLDENIYKIKILQAGSTSVLTFTLNSEIKYLSKYVIIKDNIGNYSVILESKSLMLDEPETPTITPTTPTVPAVPVTNTVVVTTTVEAAPVVTIPAITAISSSEFNERIAAIKKVSFDDKRIGKAKQVFDDEYMTTNQVIEVIKLFSFDGARLDFAKWMYKNTLDKKNYYKIDDFLTFGSSKDDLSKFIKNQPK